ncbi:GNAT family N-acetyltransferase [Nonomuraea sp. NPDC051941]|uniref:GNAT family N-acetyltransferase n=1 Tax=Nonomuraea sp. NPDC051941 TaxID=3364373 RepID=UPI0037C54CE5
MIATFVAETHLTEEQDAALRPLLAAAFPDRAGHFALQSWWLARPQWRLWLSDGDRPIAHLGVERRRIGVGDQDVYVAGIGHVCTDPAMRGRGLGVALMNELREVLTERFGFLTCLPHVQGFYEAAGWVQVHAPVVMSNVYTGERMTSSIPAMVLGEGFPEGGPIDLRGLPW